VPTVLILVAALGSAALTLGEGSLLYRNTRRVVAANQWVAHTQEVLTSIQSATLYVERVESAMSIYDINADDDQLDAARVNAVRLNSSVAHLRALTHDNSMQSKNLADLDACSAQIGRRLRELPVLKGALRSDAMLCHSALQLMTEHEQRLLEQRNADSRQQSQSQMLTEISVCGVSLIGFFILFAFLYRDSRSRSRASLQVSTANANLAHTVEIMEAHAIQARLLADARHELQLCTTTDQIYMSAAMHLGRLLPGTAGAFCMLNSSRNFMESCATWHTEGLASVMLDIFDPQACCGIRAGSQRWRRPEVAELDCRHFTTTPPDRYVCMPLMAHGETLGTVCIQCVNDEAVALVEKRSDSLQQFIQLTAMAVASLRLRTRLENQSIRDALTGLFNRHFLQIAFDRELARATRRHNTLAVFMLDVDHFKRFNDQHGHAAGDAALKHVAGILSAQVRTEDIVCRYGGEEFVVILPEMSPESAGERAESIRRAIGEVRVDLGSGHTAEVTVSIGIAIFPREGERQEDLLREADKALYAAKHTGRNRVVAAAASA